MPFKSNGRGTLVCKRSLPGHGEIRRASGTNDPSILAEIYQTIDWMIQDEDWGPLEGVRDGRLRPVDLLRNPGRAQRREPPIQRLYMIRALPSGYIKIGVAANPNERLYNLQCATWETLEFVGTLEGGMDLERRLHDRFAAHHVAREWFRPAPEILDFIGGDG